MLELDRLRELFNYDPLSGELRWGNGCPSRAWRGKAAGTVVDHGYIRVKIDGQHYLAHRLIWFYVTGKWPSHEIDHEDGNGANNKWRNLREANDAENARNRRPHKDRRLRSKGVSLVSRRKNSKGKPFAATICVDGKTIHLGVFESEKAAHAAYVQAAKLHFGDFARFK